FSSRRRHTRFSRDWSSDVCSSDLDLGVGILFPFLGAGGDRDIAMNSVAPVWDGNETWLVLGGGGLLAAFPLAYAVVMPAVYAPRPEERRVGREGGSASRAE